MRQGIAQDTLEDDSTHVRVGGEISPDTYNALFGDGLALDVMNTKGDTMFDELGMKALSVVERPQSQVANNQRLTESDTINFMATREEWRAFKEAVYSVGDHNSVRALHRVCNEMLEGVTADTVYNLDFLMPIGFDEELEEAGIDVIAHAGTFDIIDPISEDPKARISVNAFVTKEEMDDLESTSLDCDADVMLDKIYQLGGPFEPMERWEFYADPDERPLSFA